MTKAHKQWISSFLISSSFCDLAESVNRLSVGARSSFLARDYEQLTEISKGLLDLSPQTETLGRYFSALAQSRYWSNDREQVRASFENLAENKLPYIRAASLLALGGERLLLGKADQLTAKLFIESSAISLKGKYLLTFLQAQTDLSFLYSLNGDHLESYQLLKGIFPAIKLLGNRYEAVRSDYYNSVAYELNRLGEVEAALHFIVNVFNSPHLKVYPEWEETAREIQEKANEKRISSVNVPSCYNRSSMLDNLRFFPFRRSCFQISLNFYNNRHNIFDFPMNGTSESECRFISLINILDHICVDLQTGIEIEGRFLPEGDKTLEYRHNLEESKVADFFKVMNNVKNFEATNPLPLSRSREREVTSSANKAMDWLLPMLEENSKEEELA